MHVGIAYPLRRGKRSRQSQRMRTRNFTYLVRGPCYWKACLRFQSRGMSMLLWLLIPMSYLARKYHEECVLNTRLYWWRTCLIPPFWAVILSAKFPVHVDTVAKKKMEVMTFTSSTATASAIHALNSSWYCDLNLSQGHYLFANSMWYRTCYIHNE